MSAFPHLVVSPPGPKARELLKRDERSVSPSYARFYPLVVESAKDCLVKDVDGNEYVDLNAGIACLNVGHNHPKVVNAIKNQCDRFLHYSNTDFYYEGVISLAEKLTEIAPGGFEKKVYFGNSGTEAVEAAVKLAKWHTRKQLFIGFISALTHHFCADCNRLRITADGKLRPCLFSETEIDLKPALRGSSSDEEIERLLRLSIEVKPEGHTLNRGAEMHGGKRSSGNSVPVALKPMSRIGG